MKKILLSLICLAAMLTAGIRLNAQEITITLNPGWNWIGYPNVEEMNIATALGDFVPMEGDILKSRLTSSSYTNGRWRGNLSNFMPGWGYMYYSARTETTSFVFAQALSSIVTTAEPTDISFTSAIVGGMVTIPEGSHVFQRGVCWSTEPNPDIDGNHTSDGTGIGSFSDTLVGLSQQTTYYVRAYVVTDYGLTYGEEMSFTTLVEVPDIPVGAINGKFTINEDGNQVYFAQGNLQYIGSASTPYWKFADNQWDCLGISTDQNSSSQNVDRDLFGWGTSGWNTGNSCYHPWDTYNSTGSSYGPPGASNLTGTYANADWGVFNPISNGGNQPNQWRTLTHGEWGYVFNTRTTSSGIRYAKANVNDVNGVILLPDDWSTSYYDLNGTNTNEASYSSNTITASEWSTLEQHGAVFFPATGYRFGVSVKNVGVNGYYWSSSFVNGNYAYGMYFLDSNLNPQDCSNRTYGRGIRLVQVIE